MNRKTIAAIAALTFIGIMLYVINSVDDSTDNPATAYEPNVKELNAKISRLKVLREDRKKQEELELGPKELSRADERIRNLEEGYGTIEPIAIKDADGNYLKTLSPQVLSLAQAIDSKGAKQSQISVLIAAKPFDKAKWDSSAAYRKEYTTSLEPARVFQSSKDKKALKLKAISNFYTEIIQETGEAVIEVKGKPGYPVNAFSPDLGAFSNKLTTQTVIADSTGKATFKFKGPAGTIADCNLLVSSPVCSGQLKFIVNVRKPIKD